MSEEKIVTFLDLTKKRQFEYAPQLANTKASCSNGNQDWLNRPQHKGDTSFKDDP